MSEPWRPLSCSPVACQHTGALWHDRRERWEIVPGSMGSTNRTNRKRVIRGELRSLCFAVAFKCSATIILTNSVCLDFLYYQKWLNNPTVVKQQGGVSHSSSCGNRRVKHLEPFEGTFRKSCVFTRAGNILWKCLGFAAVLKQVIRFILWRLWIFQPNFDRPVNSFDKSNFFVSF